MKNKKYEDIRNVLEKICNEKEIKVRDFLIYCIFREYPIGTIDEKYGSIEECLKELEEDENTLHNIQPPLEEDEESAFAIQHARDIYYVLLNRSM